jgi:hypothetical protein
MPDNNCAGCEPLGRVPRPPENEKGKRSSFAGERSIQKPVRDVEKTKQ